MTQETKIHTISFWSLFVLAMLANILSQTIHETGHHLVYQVMGRDPVWGFTKLVQLWDTLPRDPDGWVEITGTDGERSWLRLSSQAESRAERTIAAAAGPLAGLFGAVLGLAFARWSGKHAIKQIGLALALNASLVAVLYYVRSPIRTGGDEAEIAAQLGVAKAVIEIPLGLAFVLVLVLGLRQLVSWRIRLKWLGTILLGSVATGLPLAFADGPLIAQVNAGNLWVRPVLGYALPVLLVNGLALLGLWLWVRWQERHAGAD